MWQAVFLDRDGVINLERADYVKSWDEMEILPGALDAITRLADVVRPILVVTNQSQIGRGIVTADVVDGIHQRLSDRVSAHGGRIDGYYVCPHHPNAGCSCRKPNPGLLLQAAEEHGLDLHQCVFVGDSLTDQQAALAANCQSILVESGRQGEYIRALSRTDANMHSVADLSAAVNMILAGR